MPAKLAVDEVLQAAHSRYPVMGTSVDDIIGFIHIRDLLNPTVSSSTTPIAKLLRPIRALPDSVPVLHALRELRRTASHLAIVTDEYSGTAGIITIEDLIERLVGDIGDEYDLTDEGERDRDHVHETDGLDTIDEFTDRTGYCLPSGPYTTVAGFFMAQLNAVPNLDDRILVNVEEATDDEPRTIRLEFPVIEMDRHRAARFALRRLGVDRSNDPIQDANTPRSTD